MKRLKKSGIMKTIAVAVLAAAVTACLFGCEYSTDNSDKWKTKFDISAPVFDDAGATQDTANDSGWYVTLAENFNDGLGDVFHPEMHYLRNIEYWCDDMVSVKDGKVEVLAEKSSNHVCTAGVCPTDGLFTGGITTSKFVDGVRIPTFEQAFGYFEATVKLPDSGGMWSAFWLQSESMRTVGNKGMDGSEIDIYESSFYKNPTKVGHCIHYDGYGKEHRGGQTTRDTEKDLYDGYHTFALKWTPKEYVFYVDGAATWATDFGGVSRVPAYIKLTNEVRPNKVGPYGQQLGDFTGGTFYIESVKVYQNVNYLQEIKSPSDFS